MAPWLQSQVTERETNVKLFYITLTSLMVCSLLFVILIPEVRTSGVASWFEGGFIAWIALALVCLRFHQNKMLGLLFRTVWIRMLWLAFLCAPLILLLATEFVDQMNRHLPLFGSAVDLMESSPIVQQEIGESLGVGWPVEGTTQWSGDSGDAVLLIPIHGSRGRGSIRATGSKASNKWILERLDFLSLDGSSHEVLRSTRGGIEGSH